MQNAGRNVHIVAEVGTAHEGSLDKAAQLIRAAADAGADFIKFQWVYADEILHPDTGYVALPGGNVRLYDRFKALEMPVPFFEKLRDMTRDAGCGFICSPFGLKSLSQLLELQPDAVKIASPELNHFPLLKALSAYRAERIRSGEEPVPVVLSSGVARLGDMENALACFPEFTRTDSARTESVPNSGALNLPERTEKRSECRKLPPLTLLHCVTSYPAPETEYNVRLVKNLSAVFGIPVGISDHSLDPILIPALAAACGAVMIEKHITLSRTAAGLDDPVALEPEQFRAMTEFIRKMERTNTGEGIDGEKFVRELEKKYGSGIVRQALGTGIKRLAPAETANYGRTNRSIHLLHDMKAGSVLTPDSIAVLRTEKILTPGLPPEFLAEVTGAVLVKDAVKGEGITWRHIVTKRN
ncbi:N-acetylneuraminate synthase family protein [Treponema brennaborense]|uniref:N-acetylneuraminic acid synthase domain protein n=1 Tax=Treponema brennaborense (strain DSM 12168 / CIP 105900 / DD5/3) TaxID=906968 RepID=F4LNV3_TREBD|nr:N-acetylneuraminate synthase family protein [Treponema brennaborense]AEE16938.1 N-acetylneuraminic acid synthase domain protein [Treponema brennaborense DSM 12168]